MTCTCSIKTHTAIDLAHQQVDRPAESVPKCRSPEVQL
jgi:hypothetical protein